MPWPRASGNRIQFSHENGKLMGVLALRDLIDFLAMRAELPA
jgi:hypothetical protein